MGGLFVLRDNKLNNDLNKWDFSLTLLPRASHAPPNPVSIGWLQFTSHSTWTRNDKFKRANYSLDDFTSMQSNNGGLTPPINPHTPPSPLHTQHHQISPLPTTNGYKRKTNHSIRIFKLIDFIQGENIT